MSTQSDKKYKDKKKGEAHLGQEWQSDSDSDDDSEKKSVAAIAVQEGSSPNKILTNVASSTALISDTHSSPRLFANLSDDDDDTPTCLMAKGDKVQTDSSPQTTSDYDSENEDDENYANNLIKKYGKAAATKILKLIYANDKLESCIESQGELLLEEREKNQGLKYVSPRKRRELRNWV